MSILTASEDRHLSSAEETTSKVAVRGRVCNRTGCGKLLVTSEGLPDFSRQFCSRECSRADLRDQLRVKRAQFTGGKCPLCGRHAPGSSQSVAAAPCDPGVGAYTAPPSDAPRGGVWGVLKVGYGPPGGSQSEIGTVARRLDSPGPPK
jgi:hypothetical protein